MRIFSCVLLVAAGCGPVFSNAPNDSGAADSGPAEASAVGSTGNADGMSADAADASKEAGADMSVCVPGATQCSGLAVETCGQTGQWESPVACGSSECVGGSCTVITSCASGGAGMTDCGANSENCCTSLEVPGGTYYRTYTKFGRRSKRRSRSRNSGRVPLGQVSRHRGAVPSVRRRLERRWRLHAGCRIWQARASERGPRPRERRGPRYLRNGLGRIGRQQHRTDGREPGELCKRPRCVCDMDTIRWKQRDVADQLRELVGGVRVLYLGRWLSAKRSGMGVRLGGGRATA